MTNLRTLIIYLLDIELRINLFETNWIIKSTSRLPAETISVRAPILHSCRGKINLLFERTKNHYIAMSKVNLDSIKFLWQNTFIDLTTPGYAIFKLALIRLDKALTVHFHSVNNCDNVLYRYCKVTQYSFAKNDQCLMNFHKGARSVVTK